MHDFPPKPPRARDCSRESRRYLSLFPLSNLLPNLYPIIFLPLIHRQSLVLANFFFLLGPDEQHLRGCTSKPAMATACGQHVPSSAAAPVREQATHAQASKP